MFCDQPRFKKRFKRNRIVGFSYLIPFTYVLIYDKSIHFLFRLNRQNIKPKAKTMSLMDL